MSVSSSRKSRSFRSQPSLRACTRAKRLRSRASAYFLRSSQYIARSHSIRTHLQLKVGFLRAYSLSLLIASIGYTFSLFFISLMSLVATGLCFLFRLLPRALWKVRYRNSCWKRSTSKVAAILSCEQFCRNSLLGVFSPIEMAKSFKRFIKQKCTVTLQNILSKKSLWTESMVSSASDLSLGGRVIASFGSGKFLRGICQPGPHVTITFRNISSVFA